MTTLETTCGYVWVPCRDPERHPLCERCKAIAARTRDES